MMTARRCASDWVINCQRGIQPDGEVKGIRFADGADIEQAVQALNEMIEGWAMHPVTVEQVQELMV